MIIFRRRLLVWLLKAYVRRMGRIILLFFFGGLFLSFLSILVYNFASTKIPVTQNESVGLVGTHTLNDLPEPISEKLSMGLTKVLEDGTIKPMAAKYWKIQDDGRTYVFYLDKSKKFTDGSALSSSGIEYNFKDVKIIRPIEDAAVFKLKEGFSPFLVSTSRPILKKGFIGLGEYRIKDVKLNSGFVQSISLSKVSNPLQTITYHFYPTSKALKTAYSLGEIDKAYGLLDLGIENTDFLKFPNTSVSKKTNYSQLVTLFYNNKDSLLSDKKIRSALSYALPESFENGERAHSPISSKSPYFVNFYDSTQDFTHAKKLLDDSSATGSAKIKLTIKTLPKYRNSAEAISKAWKKIAIESQIEETSGIPSSFQVFLGDFSVPKDPDQYVLWHSEQGSNITGYKNLRIDKLLEDGRKTNDENERKKIYSDFQKYLIDDHPASFLYYPFEYDLTRK